MGKQPDSEAKAALNIKRRSSLNNNLILIKYLKDMTIIILKHKINK